MANINAINQDTNQFCKDANNLSDLINTKTAIQNLGIATGTAQPVLLGDHVISNPPEFLTIFSPLGAGQKLFLPPPTGTQSLQEGSSLLITHGGSSTFAFELVDSTGTFSYANLQPNDAYIVYLLSKITAPYWIAFPANTSANASPLQTIYVDNENGDDIFGTGAINLPYKTYGAAANFAKTFATASLPYTIIINGILNITGNITLYPFVNISGVNTEFSKFILTGQVVLDASFNTTANPVCHIDSVSISAGTGIALTTTAFQNAVIHFDNVDFAGTININITGSGLNANAEFVLFENCIGTSASLFTFTNILGAISNSTINGTVTSINNSTVTNNFLVLSNTSAIVNGITVQTTSTGLQTVELLGAPNNGTFTINGTNNSILIDSSSYTKAPTLLGGASLANITLLSLADGLNASTNFTPTNYTPTAGTNYEASSVTGHLTGINNAIVAGLNPKIVSLTGDYTILPTDNNTLFTVDASASGTLTITAPAGSTVIKGFTFGVHQNLNDPSVQVLIVPATNQIDYETYAVLGINGTTFFTYENNTNSANIIPISTSGFYQDYLRVFNINIDTYTLTQGDIGGYCYFPSTNTVKTLTLPNNLAVAISKGFWVDVYNPSPNIVNISTTDNIEGPNIIYPGQVVKIVKRVFGSPNTWEISVKKGDIQYTKMPWTASGAGYVGGSIDLNNNIIVNTASTSVTLPNITTAPKGFVLNVKNQTSSICFLQTAFGGNSVDEIVNNYLTPYESVQLISDGTSVWDVVSRSSNFIQRASTTDATLTDLTHNSNYFVIAVDYIVNFRATINASDVTNGKYAAFVIEGCIARTTGSNVAFVGTPIVTVLGRTNAAYTAQVIADTVNQRLTFQVQGAVGDTLGWRAKIDCMVASNG